MSVPQAAPTAVDAVRAQLSRLCGSDDPADWAVLTSALEGFLEGAGDRLDELADAVGRRSPADVEFLSHRLRGSALTLGITDLARVCGRLEADARAGVVDGSGLLVQVLAHELAVAVAAVEQILSALPADTSTPVARSGC